MATTLEYMFEKSERLKKDLIKKYEDNKKLARQLIKSAEQNADYQMTEKDTEEKWLIYFVEELENRLN